MLFVAVVDLVGTCTYVTVEQAGRLYTHLDSSHALSAAAINHCLNSTEDRCASSLSCFVLSLTTAESLTLACIHIKRCFC